MEIVAENLLKLMKDMSHMFKSLVNLMQVHKKQKTNLTCLKIDHQPSWNMEHMEVEVLGDEIGGTGSGRAL